MVVVVRTIYRKYSICSILFYFVPFTLLYISFDGLNDPSDGQ